MSAAYRPVLRNVPVLARFTSNLIEAQPSSTTRFSSRIPADTYSVYCSEMSVYFFRLKLEIVVVVKSEIASWVKIVMATNSWPYAPALRTGSGKMVVIRGLNSSGVFEHLVPGGHHFGVIGDFLHLFVDRQRGVAFGDLPYRLGGPRPRGAALGLLCDFLLDLLALFGANIVGKSQLMRPAN